MLSLRENIISGRKKSNILVSNISKIWALLGFEALIWMFGLFYLAFIHLPGESHFSICPLNNLGFDFCPGCGLGNSISYLFKGDFISSFNTHPLAIPALFIILFRIISIINNNRRKYA